MNRKTLVWVLATAAAVAGLVAVLKLMPPELLADAAEHARNRPRLWNREWFRFGPQPVTLAFVVRVAIVMFLVISGARLIARLLHDRLLARLSLEAGRRYAIERLVSYVVMGLGFIIGLHALGIDMTSLAVLGGVLGIGVGFGLQTIASNFVSGLILLFERPIKVGDRVEIASLTGEVVRIGARSTWVRTNDNTIIIVPNADFISNRVTNWTANDQRVRLHVAVGVGYDSDAEEVREVLLAVAHSHPDVLASPEPNVLFMGFGESAIDFELRVWTATRVHSPGGLRSELNFKLFEALKSHRIEIPFPQRDVRIRSSAPPRDAAVPEEEHA
ncbi:MAG: mechanosensitive ion channel [Acidobacteria bacterium]|nr:mechanosensitive ion channel [Acidobacteriota bacterium]